MWFKASTALALVAISAAATATAAVSVDTNADGNDGECQLDCTLREAIAIALPGEMVLVPEGTYPLTLGVLRVDKDLTIIGAGPRVAEDDHLSGIGADDVHDHPDQCRLARSVGAQEAEDRARRHRQGNIFDGDEVTERLSQAAKLEGRLHIPPSWSVSRRIPRGRPQSPQS